MQKDDTVFVMMGMRHRIVHHYVAVDEGVVWNTVQRDLKPLADKLKSILPPEFGES